MDSSPNKPPGTDAADEELIDTLIAVSVVAKRLAEKLRKQQDKKKPSVAPRCDGRRKASERRKSR